LYSDIYSDDQFYIIKDKTVMTVINKLLKLLYSFTIHSLSDRAVWNLPQFQRVLKLQ
jgi:hypothetical protein